jgi:hypothetical protein
MSISTANSSISYVGNNSTSTPYVVNYPFFDASDLRVFSVTSAGVSTLLAITVNYTVSGGNGSTGSVVTTAAIPATSTVIISRVVPYTQTTSLTTGDRLPAATLEKSLDKLTMQAQQLSRNALPDTSTAAGSAPFVLQATAAGATPAWVPQSASGIAAGSITNAMLAGSITAGKLSTGGPVWDVGGNLTATSFNGNASTATSAGRLTTPRTIGLSGDVTGTASFDGSANVTIAATIPAGTITAADLTATEQRRIAKAWANFDGTTSGTWAGGSSTVTRVAASTTATITTTNPHGLTTGNTVWVLTGVVAGSYTVTVLTTTTFTITTVATTALSAVAITFQGSNIRSSYNVSSVTKNATGDYTVNFATAMADANYAVAGTASFLDATSDFATPGVGVRRLSSTNPVQAGHVRIQTNNSASAVDCPYVAIQIFGN